MPQGMRYRSRVLPRRLPIAIAFAFVCLACSAAENRFGWLGLPPVEVGQTMQQAQQQLGSTLTSAPASAEAPCQRRGTANLPGVVFIVDRGIVTRIETRAPRYATVSGARVGDPVDKVKQLYAKRLTVTPHLYFERGLTMAVYSPDRKYALVMESNDSGRVITVRGGLVPAVENLEGCGG
jgi:hypothetical protein